MLEKIPYHIITKQKSIPIPAAHPCTANYRKLTPRGANVQVEFPLAVRIWHKLVFWREIKTPAHLRHCRDSSKVKSLHLGPAMSPESPAPREPGIQMTGALA